jgi:hypothetical protein
MTIPIAMAIAQTAPQSQAAGASFELFHTKTVPVIETRNFRFTFSIAQNHEEDQKR